MARVAILVAMILPAMSTGSSCTPSALRLCVTLNPFAGESGLYNFETYSGDSPDITVRIGQTIIFDQAASSNWYHPVGFAYYPDGAHGDDWGGAERAEVEGAGELQYKIDGANPTCAEAGATGLDCYEPEFFYPREAWMAKHYTAELTITQAVADMSHGGVIYYFCHIHSKMSGKIIIQNADGSAVTMAGGGALPNPTELPLYPVPTRDSFDISCGTFRASPYNPDGGALACTETFLQGTIDTTFEKCFQAIDCQMNKEMRVKGHDTHTDAIVTFIQQMIPHHVNAVQMSKIMLKRAPAAILATDGFKAILWDIINTQNYQIHQFRNYIATHTSYTAIMHDGSNLGAESVGEHCDSTVSMADVTIPATNPNTGATGSVSGCTASGTRICMKVDLMAGEWGYYKFTGYTGPSPDITVNIGQTIVFDQKDETNWYHPVGFAYYPDGAHGETWGGAERDEVEASGELLYKIDGAATTCPDAGDTGLDCYEPEFFYPRSYWKAKHYTAELTITQAMADRSHGGVIYYFCHIHSRMSGRIIIKNADGSAVTQANGSPLANPTELPLYAPQMLSGVDNTCGTSHLEDYAGGGDKVCTQRFLCGTLDTTYEKCMQAIDCKMNVDMSYHTYPDHNDPVVTFMQQMIPHHANAVNMAKILLKEVPKATLALAMDEELLLDILYGIINGQNYQIHQFLAHLGPIGGWSQPTTTPEMQTPTTTPEMQTDGSASIFRTSVLVVGLALAAMRA